jgi:hypothetical protein
MRELEGMVESTNDLPVAEFTELAQLVGHLNQLMVMLNPSARREPVSDAEIDSLYATIEQTAPIILDLERRVVDRIKKRKKGKGQ